MFFPFKDSVEDFPYLIRKNLFEIHKDRKTQTAENYQYRYYDVECVMSVHYHWIAEITAQGRETGVAESRDGMKYREENLLVQTHVHGRMNAESDEKRASSFDGECEPQYI